MHPHLSEYKHEGCLNLIYALAECHEKSLIVKSLGVCNPIKEELTICLKSLRKDRQNKNLLEAREKRKKVEQVWSKAEEEEWGPNCELKSSLEDQTARVESLKMRLKQLQQRQNESNQS